VNAQRVKLASQMMTEKEVVFFLRFSDVAMVRTKNEMPNDSERRARSYLTTWGESPKRRTAVRTVRE
jgi:hypothetical protein